MAENIWNPDFAGKKAAAEKLEAFGFQSEKDFWICHRQLADGSLILTVAVSKENLHQVQAEVKDAETGDPFNFYRKDEDGSYSGQIWCEAQSVLEAVADSCFVSDPFKSDQAKRLEKWIRQTWQAEPEFPFRSYPDYAVWRHEKSRKWFALLMPLPLEKIGFTGEKGKQTAEILVLHLPPLTDAAAVIDHKTCFPAWHMNKKHWYSIILDAGFSDEDLIRRLQESFSSTSGSAR